MPHHLRYEDEGISEHERLLHELLAQLQAEYAEAAQPYIDRLATIRSLKTPRIFIDMLPPEKPPAQSLWVEKCEAIFDDIFQPLSLDQETQQACSEFRTAIRSLRTTPPEQLG